MTIQPIPKLYVNKLFWGMDGLRNIILSTFILKLIYLKTKFQNK